VTLRVLAFIILLVEIRKLLDPTNSLASLIGGVSSLILRGVFNKELWNLEV